MIVKSCQALIACLLLWACSGRNEPAIDVSGTIDFHVHSDPDVLDRSLNDLDAVAEASATGMKAIVLKNHYTATAGRAYIAMIARPGLEVFGGVALNRAVGGLNPHAVRIMLGMEGNRGKVVWCPTFDADWNHHILKIDGPGIMITTEDGQLEPDMDSILYLIAANDLVLATGHVSFEEMSILITRAREIGISKILVTHPLAEVPGLSLSDIKKLVYPGVYFELTYMSYLSGEKAILEGPRKQKHVSGALMKEGIQSIGADHFILTSDMGQAGHPSPVEGMEQMIKILLDEGVTPQEIDQMARINPAKLLGLE